MLVVGRGFDPSQQYVIDLLQGSRSWQVQGTASPRGDGDFASPVQIPQSAARGAASLRACVFLVNRGPTSRCAQAAVTVR